MLKPNKTFKMSKQTKRFMATYVDPVARNSYKNDMIQAQLMSEIVVKREPRKPQQGGGNYKTNDTGTASTSEE
jgi:hypothetical protein